MDAVDVATVTFVFTDLEGSTALLRELGHEAFSTLLDDHRATLRTVYEAAGGRVVSTEGDGSLAVFPDPVAAAEACLALQAATDVRLRIGVHPGPGRLDDLDYVSLDVSQAARVGAAAQGNQILLTQAAVTALGGRSGGLLDDLGVFVLKDFPDAQRLYQLREPGTPVVAPRVSRLRRDNLPAELSSFVGRHEEFGAVAKLIAAHRLVTVVGPGGVGKTRLALRVVGQSLDLRAQDTWLVALAPLADSDLIPDAIANAMGVTSQPGRDLMDTLADYLDHHRTLLVLDNCEHLIDGCAAVSARLLEASESVTILATSREALRVPGEHVLHLAPLSLAAEDDEGPEDVEAVRLFIDRASSARFGWTARAEDLGTIAELCRRLDGLPLAIELAAARAATFSLADIAADLLPGVAPRTAPARHQTLDALVEWSYRLLSPREQAVLRRLAAFPGGCNVDGAVAVIPALTGADDPVAAEDVALSLASLVDKSLAVARPVHGTLRFGLLTTVSGYASRLIEANGEHPLLIARLAEWLLALATRNSADDPNQDPSEVWALFDDELPNVRAVLASASEHAPLTALLLAAGLQPYWGFRGLASEGRRWMEPLMTYVDGKGTDLECRACSSLGALLAVVGDIDGAVTRLKRALILSDEFDDAHMRGVVTSSLGTISARRGQLAEARVYFEQSLEPLRIAGRPHMLLNSMMGLAAVMLGSGDVVTAERWLRQALDQSKTAGRASQAPVALVNLAIILRARGELVEAKAMLEGALAIRERSGDQAGIAVARVNLADIASQLGATAEAALHLRAALTWWGGTKQELVASSGLRGLAELAVGAGYAADAAALLGAVEAIWQRAGAEPTPLEQGEVEALTAALDGALSAVEVAEERRRGRALDFERAVELAVRVSDQLIAGNV